MRDKVRLWRRAQLVLAVLGSVLAAAAATTLPGAAVEALGQDAGEGGWTAARMVAAASAVALALVGFVQIHFLTTDRIQAWVRLRSVSEGLKSEIFRFRAGATPYDAPGGESANAGRLNQNADALEKAADDLARHLPDRPKRPSEPPPKLDAAGYLERRVNDQINGYYLPRARDNEKAAAFYKYLGIAAAAIGLVLSTIMAIGEAPAYGVWVPVLTTLAAAFAAHSGVERHDFLAKNYAQHAQRLERLARGWYANGERRHYPAIWSAFVHECEETISVENRGWMAAMVEEVRDVSDIVRAERKE
jgi:hypothetical protein